MVVSSSQLFSDYSLEKFFYNKRLNYAEDREFVCSGKWRQYRKGKFVPSETLVEEVESVFPGTREWLELPLWRVIEQPGPDLPELHRLMAALPPPITDHLFRFGPPATDYELFYSRRHDVISQVNALDRVNSLEALTACFALLREAELLQLQFPHYMALRTCIDLFLRHMVMLPWCLISDELFRYLRDSVFPYPGGDVWKRVKMMSNLEFSDRRSLRSELLLFLEDMSLVKCTRDEYLSALYCAEKIGIVEVYQILYDCYFSGRWEDAPKEPIIRRLIRRIRRCRRTRSA